MNTLVTGSKRLLAAKSLKKAAVLLALLATGHVANAQTLALQLIASNYNAFTGVWTDTSGNGNNATATGTKPTLTVSATPNGAPAVVFTGVSSLGLTTSLGAGDYTVFAYVQPATGNGPYAILGGANGAFEYRIYLSKQDALRAGQADLHSENTPMSTSAFSIIDATVSSSVTGGFRLNGSADGTTIAGSFTQPISTIGSRNGSENFSGSISEIDVYSGILSPSQIATVEAALTASYITANSPTAPIVLTQTTASPTTATVGGNDTLGAVFTGATPITYQWQSSVNASGSPSNNIAGATNSTLTLTNLQLANPGLYYSLQASNAVTPYVSNSAWLQLNVLPLTPQVQLIASNYDGAGNWADSSGNGNNATYGGSTKPTLVNFVTPNGAPAVNIASGTSSGFVLGSTISQSSGYTVVAYIEPSVSTGGARHSLTGGSASTALEYDIYNGNQDYLSEYTTDVGHGTGSIPTTSFSLVDLAVNSSGGTFRLNGAADGTVAGTAFGAPIAHIGNNHGGGDNYFGNIAEIDIYTGVLTPIQITNVEAQFTARYITAASLVVGAASVSPSNVTYAGNTNTLSAGVIGSNSLTAFQWQTDNGSSGATFSNITGATNTSYALNTTGLLGTYEYQLVGTQRGGTSVTGAPVTLTVYAASAPVILTATTALANTGTTDGSVFVGGNVTFSAAFAGNLPISYQWQSSGNPPLSPVNIPGATNATLTLTNLQLANSGLYYWLVASNYLGVTNSTFIQLTVSPLAASVQLVATNFASGTWSDVSPNFDNAVFAGTTQPTLAALATPNGSPAVNITGSDSRFVLASPLDQTYGYTVVAYVMPSKTTGRNALTGGSSSGALEYDIYNGNADYLREYLQDVGNGTAVIPTTNFSLMTLAVNSSGATFRLNGTNDATIAGATFGSTLTRIGNNEGNGDTFLGDIAEIDIYRGVLTPWQITNVESQFVANYVTVSSLVIGAASASPTNDTYAGSPITLSASVVGSNSLTTLNWQTDNGTGGATFSNIPGATNTTYNLDTTLLNGTYEYQLSGSQHGGSLVTGAPVTLTVNPASAPIDATDTTFNPPTATVGGNDTVSASFVGTQPIYYQWQSSLSGSGYPSNNIPGATNSTLTLSNLQISGSGVLYSLQASNSLGVVNSTWSPLTVQPLTALVQLVASNYNATSGVWTDISGNANNGTYTGSILPTLVSAATVKGGSAVDITAGDSRFLLASPLDPSSGYTVIAYVMPSKTSGRNALTGGSAGTALEYDIFNGKQDYLSEYTFDYGTGTGTIPTNSFSLLDLAVNSSGGTYRLNGAADGTVGGVAFGAPITRIGNNEGNGDTFEGEIAEIDIYSGALSANQITNVEAQLTSSYGAPGGISYLAFSTAPVISGTSLGITATNAGAGTVYLLTSTSLANLRSTWTPVWTNVLTGSGTFTTNIASVVNPADTEQFFILSTVP
jgi:hypothetical protein